MEETLLQKEEMFLEVQRVILQDQGLRDPHLHTHKAHLQEILDLAKHHHLQEELLQQRHVVLVQPGINPNQSATNHVQHKMYAHQGIPPQGEYHKEINKDNHRKDKVEVNNKCQEAELNKHHHAPDLEEICKVKVVGVVILHIVILNNQHNHVLLPLEQLLQGDFLDKIPLL